MSKLSNSDSRTIRQARDALSLLVSGAIRNLESQYGPSDEPNRAAAVDALILHLREEMDSWNTTAELDGTEEMPFDDTALTDAPID